MSELGPTSTKLEPTATERLRALLDERGVEWMPSVWSAKDETFYKVGDVGYLATELSSGKMKVCIEGYPTPEQAIAATLGDSDATGERQRVAAEVVRCRDCACFSVDDSDHDYRTGWWCKRWYTDMVMPDGFCAWGVRREGK